MSKRIVATVIMPIEEVTSTDVTWFVSSKDLQELGVEDVKELEAKIRNREIDMYDLTPDSYEIVDSEVRDVYPSEATVFITGGIND